MAGAGGFIAGAITYGVVAAGRLTFSAFSLLERRYRRCGLERASRSYDRR